MRIRLKGWIVMVKSGNKTEIFLSETRAQSHSNTVRERGKVNVCEWGCQGVPMAPWRTEERTLAMEKDRRSHLKPNVH
ncbi:hypothetical protein Trydic_g7189 [Trypoxylus dichotomus]